MPGWKPLIICDGVTTHCGFPQFIEVIKNGITDLILFSTLVAMCVLVYAGILWLTSQGSEANHKRALAMLGKVVWGYVWILIAWTLIYTITSTLLKPEFNFLLKG